MQYHIPFLLIILWTVVIVLTYVRHCGYYHTWAPHRKHIGVSQEPTLSYHFVDVRTNSSDKSIRIVHDLCIERVSNTSKMRLVVHNVGNERQEGHGKIVVHGYHPSYTMPWPVIFKRSAIPSTYEVKPYPVFFIHKKYPNNFFHFINDLLLGGYTYFLIPILYTLSSTPCRPQAVHNLAPSVQNLVAKAPYNHYCFVYLPISHQDCSDRWNVRDESGSQKGIT